MKLKRIKDKGHDKCILCRAYSGEGGPAKNTKLCDKLSEKYKCYLHDFHFEEQTTNKQSVI